MDVLTALYRREKITLPVSEVTHFKAEDKYVTAYHANGELILDDTIKRLEQVLAADFIRIHRKTLVRRTLIRRVKPQGCGFQVDVVNVTDPLKVSRRELRKVRQLLREQ